MKDAETIDETTRSVSWSSYRDSYTREIHWHRKVGNFVLQLSEHRKRGTEQKWTTAISIDTGASREPIRTFPTRTFKGKDAVMRGKFAVMEQLYEFLSYHQLQLKGRGGR